MLKMKKHSILRTLMATTLACSLALVGNIYNSFAAEPDKAAEASSDGDYGIAPIAFTGGDTIKNTATITSENGKSVNIASKSADTLITKARLQITKELLSEDIRCGDEIEYLITVTNTGDAEARNVKVDDELNPATVTFVSATSDDAQGISYKKVDSAYSQTVTWTINEIKPDAAVELHIVVRVNEGLEPGTTVKNGAKISSENGHDTDINTDDNEPKPGSGDDSGSPEFEVGAPELSITKTVDKDSARSGDVLTYTITVANNGTGSARKFVVEDALSNLVTLNQDSFTSTDPSAKQSLEGSTIKWNVEELAKDSSVTFTFKATIK